MEDVVIPKHTVIQYVRNKNGNPRGVLVAIKTPGGFVYGYSLCNKKDRFNKNMALKIALGRAEVVGQEPKKEDFHAYVPFSYLSEPHEIRKMLPAFIERCKRYYKV